MTTLNSPNSIQTGNTHPRLHSPRITEFCLFPIFLLVFLTGLVVCEALQRLMGLFGRKGVELSAHILNSWVLTSLRIAGVPFEFSGSIPNDIKGPVVIVSNHQSMFDISTIYVALHSLAPRFVSKKELGRGIPSISTCLRLSKAALIDRSDAVQALREIKRFASYIKEIKGTAVLFPEGTRAKDGILKKFKARGFLALTKELGPCTIIPVVIDNSWKLQARRYGPLPLGEKISIRILDIIELRDINESSKVLANAESSISREISLIRAGKD